MIIVLLQTEYVQHRTLKVVPRQYSRL